MEGDKPAGRPGYSPAHPGRIIKRNIDALGMTIEAFADHIGTTRQTVHAIIAGRSSVGAEMAVRLARAFNTTPQFWLKLQANHTVWEVERKMQLLSRIRPLSQQRVPPQVHSKEVTGTKVAAAAARTLSNPGASPGAKSAAGSAPTQRSGSSSFGKRKRLVPGRHK